MASFNPLTELPDKVDELMHSLLPLDVFGTAHDPKIMPADIKLSTHVIGWFIAVVVFLVVMFAWKKRYSVIPRGKFVNMIDFVWEFIRVNVVEGIIGHDARVHLPFISTIFFFLLVNNLLGLIPGAKPGTGVISGTFAASVSVFIYFNYAGIKAKGGWKYIKGIVPHGVPAFIAPVIFVIEIASMCLRPVTQALRLFANIYAGHIILGIFAILTEIFAVGITHGAYVWGLTTPLWFALLFALYILELMVAFVQAYVFTMLTAVYVDSATSSH